MPTEDEDQKWWTEYGPHSSANWNFDSIPESELIACCFWEYARESKTIKLLADVRWAYSRRSIHREDYKRDPALIGQHDKAAERIEGWAKSAGFDCDAFLSEFWKTDFPLLGIYEAVTELVRDGTLPWQHQTVDLRAYVAGKLKQSWLLLPLGMARVGDLEELWQRNSAELLEIRSRAPDEESELCAQWSESVPIASSRNDECKTHENVTAAFTVDFSRFTDDEISEAFREWLSKHRPHEWKTPRRVFPGARKRGRKLVEYRVALERLGLMRLLHWHSPASLREKLPDAWKKIAGKEPVFRREIREVTRFFRAIFPFLPETERPQSEERFGTWMPPMLKAADEEAREMRLEGGRK